MSDMLKPLSDAPVDRAVVAPVGGVIKRATDIVLATIAIALMLPLLVFCAIAALLASGGPIVSRQRRIGFRGRAFECFGFATGGKAGATRLGAALNNAGLDELPQLFNVLRGDMSIVGPRPVSDDAFDQCPDQAVACLSCKPGITGPWRVHGTASRQERIKLDCDYARRWSLLLDAKIAMLSLSAALGPAARR
jgi:exopolysaccharide production protein ExoY